ncbi:UNVERIFIED_CONTAM: hypothetical protein RKD43_003503 [Streptomyces graminofaciens]
MRVRDRQRRVGVERQPAGQQLEEHDPDRIQVGTGVHTPAEGLLGGEVLRGADDHARLRHGRDARLHRTGDAEVHHLDDAALGHHHVAGLDVAVDQAHLVAGLQGREHVGGDLERLVGGHRAVLLDVGGQDGSQRLTLHVLHDDVRHQRAVELVLAGVEDGHDVGVGQLGDGLRLTPEPLAERLLAPEFRVERLDGHLAVQRGVVGQVDGSHAAFAEQIAKLIPAARHGTTRIAALRAVLAHDCASPSARWPDGPVRDGSRITCRSLSRGPRNLDRDPVLRGKSAAGVRHVKPGARSVTVRTTSVSEALQERHGICTAPRPAGLMAGLSRKPACRAKAVA